jgi:hypothetical protein
VNSVPALAYISRAVAVLYALVALFCIALPFLNAFAGTYEGAPMILTCFILAGFFGVVGAGLYDCYRYARKEGRSRIVLSLISVFVVFAGLIGAAVVLRIVWGAVRVGS